jgi:site-specific DNA-cytosine methylase
MSGARIALDKLNVEVNKYYSSEIDKYANTISEKNYPDIIRLGDVNNWEDWYFPEPIDLLIGGSPCQGFSFAGKQLNFNDPRSALFFKFVDVLHDVKPKYFLLENVRMKKEYQDIISKYLGVEPIYLDSNLVSAQNRKRYYWTNIPNIIRPEDKGIVISKILEMPGITVVKSHGEWCERQLKSQCLDANYHKGADNHGQRTMIKNDENIRKLTPIECERLQTVPDNYTEGVSNTQRYKMLGNGFTVDIIAHILKGMK